MHSSIKTMCPAHQECVKLAELLKSLAVVYDSVDAHTSTCLDRTAWPCEVMLKNARSLYLSVDRSNYETVFQYLVGLFSDKTMLLDYYVGDSLDKFSFTCPDIGIEIRQPCAVASCAFFSTNSWFKNCILYYRLRHERDVLSVNELSFLLNRDSTSVRSSISKTIQLLGGHALKDFITHESISGASRRLPAVARVCSVCETSIPEGDRGVVRGGFCYCSVGCVGVKPPTALKLEREFSLPINKILSICVSKFSSVKAMCSALSIGQSVFLSLCSRYDVAVSVRSTDSSSENASV